LAYDEFHFRAQLGMRRKPKPRKPNLLLAGIVAFAVLLLLLRMIVFVAGHAHHPRHGF
jgi:hypothetical protein